jgi:hypothetical protein
MRSAAPVVDVAMAWALGLAGEAAIAIALPPLSHDLEQASDPDDTELRVDGLLWAGAERADRIVVGSSTGVVVVDAALLAVEPVGGFDPNLGLALAKGAIDPDATTKIADAEAWQRALDAGRRALASQMVGAARRMLADTASYVQERHQYGRAIGSFQTVKHRLTDVHVAATAAAAAVEVAWTDESELTSAAAKALAGRAQQLASKHCQQVHGGIAFTVEHGFHGYVRRGHLLDAALGTATDLTRLIGRRLIETTTVPRIPVL